LLVGLIIVALFVYFLVFRDNENTEAVTEPEPITITNETDLLGIKENNDIVAAYVNFVENNKEKMSLDAYTNEALSKLIEATNAIANEVGYDVQADIEKAKEYAKNDQVILLKQHMRITLEGRCYPDQRIAKHPKAKYPGLTDEVVALKVQQNQ
jgi:hypothetical protein